MSEGVIRCPAIRSLIQDGSLKHQNLQTASVADLMEALSSRPERLRPHEPGSLANIAGFFAIFNHRVPRDGHAAAAVLAGGAPAGTFDLRLFGSAGDHPGTVDFFSNDEHGRFQAEHFASVMREVAGGDTLTIQGIARMIIAANARDPKASTLDLVKSAGEWALMVCALRTDGSTTDISVADLRRMYEERDSRKLTTGSAVATALDWIAVTIQITAAIAKEKGQRIKLARRLHSAFKDLGTLCPCVTCNARLWKVLIPGQAND